MRTWRAYDLVFFDCDSTLTYIEGIDELARLKGLFDEVQRLTAAAGVEIRADEWGVDVCLTSSQKALALPPGLAKRYRSSTLIRLLPQTYLSNWWS